MIQVSFIEPWAFTLNLYMGDGKMFRCGLLIVSPSCVKSRIPALLNVVSKQVRETLYIEVYRSERQHLTTLYEALINVYGNHSRSTGNLNIKVLLPGHQMPRTLGEQPEVAFAREHFGNNAFRDFDRWIKKRFASLELSGKLKLVKILEDEDEDGSPMKKSKISHVPAASSLKIYEEVVLGGTFDHLHDGHRLLLSVACLLCRTKITIGLTDGSLLKNKVLKELIQSFEDRKQAVQDFVEDIKPGLQHDIVPITDPIGPAGTDPNYECLIVSEETVKGGLYVNNTRVQNGLNKLDIHAIDLVADDELEIPGQQDEKMSSTGERHRLLGTLLRPVRDRQLPVGHPYVIGLTGGIASGKSAISKRLESLGASVINCDRLGHQTYLPGEKAYLEIIDAFGEQVLAEDKTIDRKTLGQIVFSDSQRLSKLNQIVWPQILVLVEEQIKHLASEGATVVVIEAAVLLEANWNSIADEVWVSIIPEKEALNRILSRDGMSEEQAENRIKSQMTNEERVQRANVVLSSLWEPAYTHRQVEKAWIDLQHRLPHTSDGSS